jgi:hypothetical protein
MAEPQPRIGPAGTTTGVSLRSSDVPQSSVKRVKEICLHYVRKCSGKYIDNKAAARYVHQMADEVIGQLSGIIAQIRRYEAEPEVYQALLDDWEHHFPPSLGAVGTPKAIAAALTKQAEEIRKLSTELEAEKMKHAADVSNVVKAMEAQLVAYRSGIMNERKQITASHSLSIDDLDGMMAAMRNSFKLEKEQIIQQQTDEIQKTRKIHERQTQQLLTEMKSMEAALLHREDNRQKEFESTINGKNDFIRSLEDKIRQLQKEAVHQSGILAPTGSNQSVVSLDIDLFESDSDIEEEVESETTSATESDFDSNEDTSEENLLHHEDSKDSTSVRGKSERRVVPPKPRVPKEPNQKAPKKPKDHRSKPVIQKGTIKRSKSVPDLAKNPVSAASELRSNEKPISTQQTKNGRTPVKPQKKQKKLQISGVVGEAVRKLKEVRIWHIVGAAC